MPARVAVVSSPGASDAVDKTAGAESMADLIIRHIKNGVRSGKYVPGQRLIEGDIQDATGASRGPVREAMRRLAAEGLLEIPHQKGARVRRLSRTEIETLYDVREAIEGLAARHAAANIGMETYRARLKAALSSFESVYDGSPQSYMDYNERFHGLIIEISRNEFLAKLLVQLQLPLFMMRLHAAINFVGAEKAHEQHLVIGKAILDGESRRAELEMRKHIRSTKRGVLGAMFSSIEPL